MPIVLPWTAHHGPPVPTPAPTPLIHYGNWYHHPSAAKCAEVGFGEEAVGTDGCTWRRHPTAFMGYGPDFVDAGWVMRNTTIAAIEANGDIFQGIFDRLSSGRCCGC
jgi:hypothetical protein